MSRNWDAGSTRKWRRIRKVILKRDSYCCQRCGQTEGSMHIDHVVPKRLNGSDDEWNLITLCQFCNLSKGGRFFDLDGTPPTLQGREIPNNLSVSHD